MAAWVLAILFLAGGLFAGKLAYVFCTALAAPRTRGALFTSTSAVRIQAVLEAVPLKPGQLLVDLGCGDGRVLGAARKRYGVRGLGFEINPLAYVLARLRTLGLKEVRIKGRDFWQADLSRSDVVFCYLFPEVMKRLSQKLQRELKPGTRVVSCNFPLPGWRPDQVLRPARSRHSDPIYLYRLPEASSAQAGAPPSGREDRPGLEPELLETFERKDKEDIVALKTKEEYLASLRDLDHRVYLQGELVPSVPDHPISRPGALALAETFFQAEQEENQDLFLVRSPLTGETINRFAHIQESRDDLVKKILMLRKMGQRTACCFQRCAGLDCINTVYAITHRIDQEGQTNYHGRFRDFVRYLQENDLVPAACMTDAKGDRSLPPSGQADKDQYLHIVEEKKGGIVIRGAKLHITGGVNSHELVVVPTRALREEDRDYAVAVAVPADSPGVTLVYGRQPSDTRRLEGPADLGNLYFGGCEALIVFDDVFVPEERIFMKGEFQFAGPLVELFAAHHRASYGGCKVGIGDVLLGATAAIAEAQGIQQAAHCRDKLAEMVHLNETLHAGALASALRGSPTPSGAFAVDPLLANVCKLNVTRFPFEIARLAQDIAGGLLVTMPSLKDQDHPEIGRYVKKYLVGKEGVAAEKRMRLLRLIENITLGPGAVSYLPESIHGAGSPQAQKIMISRLADLERAKAWAYHLCGLAD